MQSASPTGESPRLNTAGQLLAICRAGSEAFASQPPLSLGLSLLAFSLLALRLSPLVFLLAVVKRGFHTQKALRMKARANSASAELLQSPVTPLVSLFSKRESNEVLYATEEIPPIVHTCVCCVGRGRRQTPSQVHLVADLCDMRPIHRHYWLIASCFAKLAQVVFLFRGRASASTDILRWRRADHFSNQASYVRNIYAQALERVQRGVLV